MGRVVPFSEPVLSVEEQPIMTLADAYAEPSISSDNPFNNDIHYARPSLVADRTKSV